MTVYQAGLEAGNAVGSRIIEGNKTVAVYVLAGIEDGNPRILNQFEPPLPLSEKSLPEFSSRYSIDLEDEHNADAFKAGYYAGFWDTVERDAKEIVGSDG